MKRFIDRKTYLRNLSQKRIGSAALILNSKNELLMVKPNYKDHWSIPGGIVNINESPLKACVREVKEEIGLTFRSFKLAAVFYVLDKKFNDESIQFHFIANNVTDEQIKNIKLEKEELDNYKFVPIKKYRYIIKIWEGQCQ